jgi:hypothetical protein
MHWIGMMKRTQEMGYESAKGDGVDGRFDAAVAYACLGAAQRGGNRMNNIELPPTLLDALRGLIIQARQQALHSVDTISGTNLLADRQAYR